MDVIDNDTEDQFEGLNDAEDVGAEMDEEEGLEIEEDEESARAASQRRRESLLITLVHKASLNAPKNEVLHDAYAVLPVLTRHDAELAVQSLDPDSLYPRCEWCEEVERHGERPDSRGRWYLHSDCYDAAEADHLASIHLPPREWAWGPDSPAPACGLRQRPRPAPLTDAQIAEIAGLRQWRIGQVEIAKRLGVNQATISRGLERAERLGVRPARIRGEQQSMIDYLGGGEAA